MKYFDIFINTGRYILTYGVDGLVALHDCETNYLLFNHISHHRTQSGIRAAQIDTMQKYILTLGYDGSLILFKIKSQNINHDKTNTHKYYESNCDGIQKKFDVINKYVGFVPAENLNDRWTEIEKRRVRDDEDQLYANIRASVISNLMMLKEKIKILLDKNETASEDERLPIQAFNLDDETTAGVVEGAKLQRQKLEKELIDIIETESNVGEWIKKMYWDHMVIKGTKVEYA